MLLLILLRVKTEDEMKDKSRSFESIAQKRLDAIKANVIELENSRKESQNLIENLKKEIAERKEIENALRESEEKFRLAFNTNPDSININRLHDGMYTEVNQGFTDITGYTPKDVIGKTSYEIDIWVDVKDRKRLVRGLKKNGKYYNLEANFRKKDRSIIPGLMSAAVITLDNIPHILTITRDISSIKKAQEELEKSEIRFRNAFENAASGMCISSIGGEFLQVNTKLCEILGYSSEELLGISFRDITHPDDIALGIENIETTTKGEIDSYDYEKRFLKKDGEVIWAEVSASPISYSENKPVNFITHIIDITEKKKAIESLKLQRFYQQVILDAAPYSIWFKDTQNNFVRVNKAAADIAKKTVEEVEGKSTDEIFPFESKKYFEDDLEVIHSKKPKLGIIETITTDGITSWVRTDKIPWYDEEGKVAGVVAYSLDITEVIKAEETAKKERDLAQRYLNIAGVMFVSLNSKGEIVIINKKGCDILGYNDAKELIGKNWLESFLPATHKKEVKNVFREQMAGNIKTFEYYENPIVTKSGEERLIAFHNTVLVNPDGKITGVLFSGEDITEREKAKMSLLETQYHLSTIYNTVGDIIYYLKVEGKDKYKFVSVNEMFCNATGLTMDQVNGKFVHEVIPEPSLTHVLSNYKKAIKEKTIVRWEEVTPYPTGLKTGEVSIAPVYNSSGDCTYLVGSVHDITEKKKAEEEIKKLNAELEIRVMERTTELEKANKELEELNDVFVGREMRIIELKEEIERLKSKLNA